MCEKQCVASEDSVRYNASVMRIYINRRACAPTSESMLLVVDSYSRSAGGEYASGEFTHLWGKNK